MDQTTVTLHREDASQLSPGASATYAEAGPPPAAADPLSDVIDWLGHADLSGDIAAKEPDPPDIPTGDALADTPFFVGRQKPSSSSNSGVIGCFGINKESDAHSPPELEPEEEEWEARLRQTGAAGRLVTYEEGERPRSDFLLRGGCGRRIMVTAVTEGSKAALAGIKAGDVLVSVDGKKNFAEKSANDLHETLRGPVVLVFMGFVGKLQAEVRLNYKQKVCGLSSQHQVVFGRPDAPVHVVDEVIFQPGMATLMLATSPPDAGQSFMSSRSMSFSREAACPVGDDGSVSEDLDDVGDEGNMEDIRPDHSHEETASAESIPAVYELRGPEARSLVSRALSRAHLNPPPSPRYVAVGNAAGDRAQVPRSIMPTSFTSSQRLDGRFVIAPDLLPKKPFHFATKDDSQEPKRSECGVASWWDGMACPRDRSRDAMPTPRF